jgi:hypothetical protein
MSKEIMMVCARADAPLTTPGSVFTESCSRCAKKVMLAPSGQRFLRDHGKENVGIICHHCLTENDTRALQGLVAPVADICREMDAAVPNDYRRRN